MSLDPILEFIEACPYFHRSGYTLDDALHWIPRVPRSAKQSDRMRRIVIAAVTGQLHLPFRYIPALARAVDVPELRAELLSLARDFDTKVQLRAMTILDGLSGPPWDELRTRQRRESDRLAAMVTTASRRRSVTLLRHILAIDPLPLSSQGRRMQAVAFERVMNWKMLDREALLEVARRIDGPEMAGVWRFALERADEIGETARWLKAELEA
jgi:hypothetical protein